MGRWETLGAVDPRRLVDARLELHWAAQTAAAVGKQLLPHQPDWSEQSFEWARAPRALFQGLVAAPRPFRAGLRPSPPALVLLGPEEGQDAELPLAGRTLPEAYAWLEREVEARLGRPLERPLDPAGQMPAHPVGAGAAFSAGEGCGEIARWFADAAHLLAALAARQPGASPVRCWPHHFDIATLIPLDPPGTDPERARSINAGLSPGDAGRAEPYFYVVPFPHPSNGAQLPELEGEGSWNRDGWTGAVLAASRLVEAGSAAGQAAQAERFVDSAVAACRRLLEEV